MSFMRSQGFERVISNHLKIYNILKIITFIKEISKKVYMQLLS